MGADCEPELANLLALGPQRRPPTADDEGLEPQPPQEPRAAAHQPPSTGTSILEVIDDAAQH